MRVALLALVLATPGAAEEAPVSGFDFLQPETQALQEDDFANPGMLWVDIGAELWADASAGQSCADCHGAAESAMREAGAHYPRWSEEAGRVISLEQQVNLCREERQGADAFAYESTELNALTAYVAHQARGLPMDVARDGPAAESFARGEAYYMTPRGQLDLSCADCHRQNVGARLRGEVISQGQINGYPAYRQIWQNIGSANRIFAWCNEAVRAEPLEPGTQEYVDLELYLRALGSGLVIEAPAVRR